jgi:gamma-glutamylcyclotransferase (GGCT)/AIG2-like uncharacterized protein YtfP
MTFFSYGTLRDAEFQRELFGHSVPTTPARLDGWQTVFTSSGYLTLVRADGASVEGALVEVNDRELAICDAWEEVPRYLPTPMTVVCDGRPLETWAYVRPVEGEYEPAPPGALARADRAAVIAAIRAFRAGG